LSRKILINGQRAEEMRVAIVDNGVLEDFEIETQSSGLSRNNIYRGTVVNIAPSLNAAFVDFGEEKNGFLAFNDVVESVYHKTVREGAYLKMSDVLVAGQQLIVQVIKDAAGSKGAQLTTNVSIAGRYLVLRPKDAKSGVSRKVDDEARVELSAKAKSLDLPEGIGCIVRTNAMDQSRAVLLREAKALLQLWKKIEAEAVRGSGAKLLYNDHDIVVQVLRDYFDATVSEVLIDCEECFQRARAYLHATMPAHEDRIKRYVDRVPMFSKFDIERQIEQIFDRRVNLPSGGYIVIDPTEALTAIDVNSAKSTKRESQDLTAYHTNLEASVEIARQLRMRDIGGLIVVDFIDMRSGKHQRDVERAVRTAMARDKARNKSERISANGLMEINRQRISQALSVRMHFTCPTCEGRGFIPNIEMFGLNLIRAIEARAVQGKIGGALVKLHPEIAERVQNLRRHEIVALEKEFNIKIEVVADREISRSDEQIEWLPKPPEVKHVEKAVAMSVADTAPELDEDDDFVRLERSFSEEDADLKDLEYRPNDYEEFASDEARERRQKRRNNKRKEEREGEDEIALAENGGDKDEKPEANNNERRSRRDRKRNGESRSKIAEVEGREETQDNEEKIAEKSEEKSEEKIAEKSKETTSRRKRRTRRAPIEVNDVEAEAEAEVHEEAQTRLPFSAREFMEGAASQKAKGEAESDKLRADDENEVEASDEESPKRRRKQRDRRVKNGKDQRVKNGKDQEDKAAKTAPEDSSKKKPERLDKITDVSEKQLVSSEKTGKAEQKSAKEESASHAKGDKGEERSERRRSRSTRKRSLQLRGEGVADGLDPASLEVVEASVEIRPMTVQEAQEKAAPDRSNNGRKERKQAKLADPMALTPDASPVAKPAGEKAAKAESTTRQRRTQRPRPSEKTAVVSKNEPAAEEAVLELNAQETQGEEAEKSKRTTRRRTRSSQKSETDTAQEVLLEAAAAAADDDVEKSKRTTRRRTRSSQKNGADSTAKGAVELKEDAPIAKDETRSRRTRRVRPSEA